MPHCGWAPCVEPLPSFWPHRGIALGAFVWFGKRGSPTRRPLLSRNAGTAEPVRVSPPEAVAYPLELARDEDGAVLVWTGSGDAPQAPPLQPARVVPSPGV